MVFCSFSQVSALFSPRKMENLIFMKAECQLYVVSSVKWAGNIFGPLQKSQLGKHELGWPWSTVPLMALVGSALLNSWGIATPSQQDRASLPGKAEALSSDQTAPAALHRPCGCCWAFLHANLQA